MVSSAGQRAEQVTPGGVQVTGGPPRPRPPPENGRVVAVEVGGNPGVVTGLAVVRSHVSGDGFRQTKAISLQFSSHVAFITRYLPDVTEVMTHQ